MISSMYKKIQCFTKCRAKQARNISKPKTVLSEKMGMKIRIHIRLFETFQKLLLILSFFKNKSKEIEIVNNR